MLPSAEVLPAIIDRLKQFVAALDIHVAADQIDDTTYMFEGGLGLDFVRGSGTDHRNRRRVRY